MEVILLERVGKLGHMGDTVRVKDGYARNFLLPRGKALRATEANKKKFESQRADLEARNLETEARGRRRRRQLDGKSFVIIRQAGETGQLYGSVSARDIAEAISAARLPGPSQPGRAAPADQDARPAQDAVHLHPRSRRIVTINVARSPEQAERQAKGEDLTCARRPRWTISASKSARRSPKPAPARASRGNSQAPSARSRRRGQRPRLQATLRRSGIR